MIEILSARIARNHKVIDKVDIDTVTDDLEKERKRIEQEQTLRHGEGITVDLTIKIADNESGKGE